MKTKKKNVYYCDYCKKHNLLPLIKHELHCTANPNRQCRLCGRTESLEAIINKYEKQVGSAPQDRTDDKKIFLQNIRAEFDDECPLCILSVLRQLKLTQWPYCYQEIFDLKAEMQDWWDAINKDTYCEAY